MQQDEEERPRAVLVAVQLPGVSEEQLERDLDELVRLVTTLGLDVVGRVTQRRQGLRAASVLGLGKLIQLARWTGGDGKIGPRIASQERALERRPSPRGSEIEIEDDEDWDAAELDEDDADDADDGDEEASLGDERRPRAQVVVVDHDLTPSMQRNLERATGAQVLDRSQVIVEIFHRHAKSREAKLQVEIARLNYIAPRLRETGGGADRQRGGIGGKGAGESAVELDRRKVRDRIAELRRELAQIEAQQATRRAARRDQRRVALVGYTNAGKSSLMRALTSSEVYVADKLFATLDTTVRALRPEVNPRILISDTVGFIKKLPHDLVASFRSTLSEALEASLLLYLVDASDPSFRDQLAVTREVLREIGATEVPSILVLNKSDRLSDDARAELSVEYPDALLVSAKDPAGVRTVREALIGFFDGDVQEDSLFVPYALHGRVSAVYDAAQVVAEFHDGEGTHLRVRAPRLALARLKQELAEPT
jgi:GTP-binding protein HflX